MIDQAPGYARPLQRAPVTADVEQRIAASCPGRVVAPWSERDARHPYWGPWRGVLTGAATYPSARFAGASGGADGVRE